VISIKYDDDDDDDDDDDEHYTCGPCILLTLSMRADRLEFTVDNLLLTTENCDCCNAHDV